MCGADRLMLPGCCRCLFWLLFVKRFQARRPVDLMNNVASLVAILPVSPSPPAHRKLCLAGLRRSRIGAFGSTTEFSGQHSVRIAHAPITCRKAFGLLEVTEESAKDERLLAQRKIKGCASHGKTGRFYWWRRRISLELCLCEDGLGGCLGAIVAECPAPVERIKQKNDCQEVKGKPPAGPMAVFRIPRETRMSSCVHHLSRSRVMR